ncbi:hypothetical protein C8255_06070 [filamentous cyanobacterium CCP3]|nr:hypothetical protein C8255_06070 [filamentous cyanobacterium CCP3]
MLNRLTLNFSTLFPEHRSFSLGVAPAVNPFQPALGAGSQPSFNTWGFAFHTLPQLTTWAAPFLQLTEAVTYASLPVTLPLNSFLEIASENQPADRLEPWHDLYKSLGIWWTELRRDLSSLLSPSATTGQTQPLTPQQSWSGSITPVEDTTLSRSFREFSPAIALTAPVSVNPLVNLNVPPLRVAATALPPAIALTAPVSVNPLVNLAVSLLGVPSTALSPPAIALTQAASGNPSVNLNASSLGATATALSPAVALADQSTATQYQPGASDQPQVIPHNPPTSIRPESSVVHRIVHSTTEYARQSARATGIQQPNQTEDANSPTTINLHGGIHVQITAQKIDQTHAQETARAIAGHVLKEMNRITERDRFRRGLTPHR